MKNKGFSLIEALIALLILGFVVIAILAGFSAQINTNKKTRQKNIAIALAEDRLEQVLKYSRTQLNNMGVIGSTIIEDFSSPSSTDPFTHNIYKGVSDYEKMRRTTLITQNPTNPELLDIQVIVEYGKIGKGASARYPFRVVLTTTRGGQ